MGTVSKPQASNNRFIDEYAKVNDAFIEATGKLIGRNFSGVGTIYAPAAKTENLLAFNLPDINESPLV
ncbi:MAG: hypothetical protein JW873_04535 [Candidatus Saganbacteria bacterium]|nr:hypothetical protein [Candidatus Saganbacteria bacterium]